MMTSSNLAEQIPQRLVFFLGKGGVGRTTLATSFALACAQRGEKTLIVQWALHDSVSLLFSRPAAGHDSSPVAPNLWTMNFSPDEAIREYFIDHLKLKLIYNLVIENKHVQRLIHAAPGVQELFFLGRLFWLVCLSEEIKGTRFDRVIVDAQATGHGVSLFTIAPTIAQFGMTGPLASECDRVAQMLADPQLVSAALVTIPEELPVEETLEFLPKITTDLGREPGALFINRSIAPFARATPDALNENHPAAVWRPHLSSDQSYKAVSVLHRDLRKRDTFEKFLRNEVKSKYPDMPVYSIPDIGLSDPEAAAPSVLQQVATTLRSIMKPSEQQSSLHINRQSDSLDISEDQR